MTTPRITPGGLRELGVVNHVISAIAGRALGGPRPNIFTTLGRQRGLFRAWLWYSGKMMPGGKLPRRETEMVILHIATLRDCEYERRHHVRIGRRVGLSTEQVEHAGNDAWDGWSVRERALLTAATQLVRARDIDDPTWAALRAQLNEAETIELLMLCGQYDALATTLMTLRVQPE
jgi:alkylhydroperoxidase family enzyme